MIAPEEDFNGSILVEFPRSPGVQKVSLTSERTVERSAVALARAMDTVRNMAIRFRATVEDIPYSPSEVSLEFGIKLDAEAGALVARTGVEATLNVKLVWKREVENGGGGPTAEHP